MDINNIFSQTAVNNPTFIIAELSANHGGNLEIALETVRAAKRAGADAIKIQTYAPDTMTLDADNEDFFINQGTQWDGRTLYNLYEEAMLPWEWHQAIFDVAKQEGLICFSTPFDETAVDFLEKLGNPIYKIASFEIQHIPLLKKVANTGKPIIISTGIAEKEDIELALKTCKDCGNHQIILLKCTSAYPAPPEEANLKMIQQLRLDFNVLTGLSDHSLGVQIPIISVGLGARVIEKHFILNKSVGGPDASFSLDENEFKEMVDGVRMAEKALGKVDYKLGDKSIRNKAFGRSIYVSNDVNSNEKVTNKNIKVVRPGMGLHPKFFEELIGKRFNKPLKKGDRLSLDDVT